MRQLQRICLWVFGCVLLLLSHLTSANDGQRYLAVLLLNTNRSLDIDLDLLEGGVKAGCNAVHLTIYWDQVYTTSTSQADWRKYDNQINLAQKLGVKIALRILVGRHVSRIQGFWENEHRQRDQQGQALISGYSATYFSYAHRPSVEKARAFIKEVCQRYNNLQQQGIISWVSVSTTPTQETAYYHENAPEGWNYPTVFDYSPSMQQEFRIWLTRKYKKIARLNVFWETEYRSFEEVTPPVSFKYREQVFWGAAGRDWYVFRHAVFKQFVEQTTQTIKEVNSSYRVMTDFGSVFDQISVFCGTLAFRDLNRTTDGVKINDDLLYDHRFSTDLLRSNVLPGQWVLNEVFPILKQGQSPDLIPKQIDENFEHGAHWVSMVIDTRATLDLVRPIIRQTEEKWLKKPFSAVNPVDQMSYTLSRVVEFGYYSGGVYSEWLNRAGHVSNRKPVNIRMVEDLLTDTLQGSINQPPAVQNMMPTKYIKVHTDFTYRLKSEVFADIDGAIEKVEVSGLPPWLTFQNNVFSGTPAQTGIYRMLLRATDDDGASVETAFTIIVDNTGRANQVPVLQQAIPAAKGVYKQPFTYTISDQTFSDPDGFISRLEVTGLPRWAQFGRKEIRGLADTVGVYIVTVRAFDDEDAVVQTTFTITVSYPVVSFDLVQAGKPGERFLIKRLQNGEALEASGLPPLLNIYASCDAVFDEFELQLTGTYAQKAQPESSPFALFKGDGGFPTVVGSYQLKGNAYFQKELISSITYRFQLIATDPVTKLPISLTDWTLYPNPCNEFLNIKLPDKVAVQKIQLVNTEGQTLPVLLNAASVTNQLLSINLRELALPPGLYFLKLQKGDFFWEVFKFLKQ
ncbi:putative Ig domain-containing protein [Runella slithyformis]|uniref:Glycoside hydrolase family 42 domain protein n=1 Tax=Runella slithyformis (strain ATCC 29530 / DSM 19594 / LMG 11500 / NCIMB 11436 / LSU 4) TaxID=761193 RepID=A0A7U3ZQN6_RUNSL|nr:putative Ig domain-containing protein [Runella slithyformis]AEI51533.1 Glycoside hydrolase family 42 domain protein [Runella slithyformis DSM 19594]